MTYTVIRGGVRSPEEVEVRKIINDYEMDNVLHSERENNKKIRALLKKISIKHPDRLKDIIEQMMVRGYNVFHFAAAKNRKKLVVALLKYHPGILNSLTLSRNTALHLAYRYGSKKVIAFLEDQPEMNKGIKNLDGLTASEMPFEKDKPLNEAEGFSIKKNFIKED